MQQQDTRQPLDIQIMDDSLHRILCRYIYLFHLYLYGGEAAIFCRQYMYGYMMIFYVLMML
jgi:hypothetical protein